MGITIFTRPGPEDFPHLHQFASDKLATGDAQMIFPNRATGIGEEHTTTSIIPRPAIKAGLE